MKDNSIVYHYCSLNTFFNIINNQSIWISDISKSNDSAELQWVYDQCKIFLDSRKDNHEYYSFNQVATEASNILCWCFCMSEMKDQLGQWRGYGDDGKGIAIGFDKDIFSQLAESLSFKAKIQKKEIPDWTLDFCKVDYKNDGINEMFEKWTSKKYYTTAIQESCKEDKKLQAELLREEFVDKLWIIPSLLLMSNAYKYKKECFSEEKEWRVVISTTKEYIKKAKLIQLFNTIDDNMFVSKIVKSKSIKYKLNENKLISCVDFVFNNIGDLIKEIVIGPKCNTTIEDIELFLRVKGITRSDKESIIITKSEMTYR